nr:DUF4160 domain-containing protein [Brenneria tiliae]
MIFAMYFFDNAQHKFPHVHVSFGEYELIINLNTCVEIAGYLPNKQRKTALAHVSANQKRLLQMWQLAVTGINPGKL